jgi:hypothetical protein
MILAMSEWFGWLQQKALADPFAKRYAQAAKGVLAVLAAFVFTVFAAFIIAYNPSTVEPSPKSTDRTWADNVLVVQIAVGFFVLGVVTVLGGLLTSIKTSSPSQTGAPSLVSGRCGESRAWRCYPVRRHSSDWGSPAPY